MELKLISHTKNYHKLVESVARVCYQSYSKDAPNSHNFIKAIMAKGHISVASVGNMVFEINKFSGNPGQGDSMSQVINMLMDLTIMHEITPFIKWSFPDDKKNPNGRILISMNMLTLLDIYRQQDDYDWSSELLNAIIAETDKVPYLKWFYDKSVELEESPNEYTAKGTPSLY